MEGRKGVLYVLEEEKDEDKDNVKTRRGKLRRKEEQQIQKEENIE